jgi:hypothetical protein
MRRRSCNIAAVTVLTLSLSAVGWGGALAQDAPFGGDVPILDEYGTALGTVTVREFEDPFTAFDPSGPPEVGMRFVGLAVAFTAADDQTFDAYSGGILLHDADGYLHTPVYVPRPADVLLPDLQSQTLAPGNRISGFLGYVIPADAEVDEILYALDSYRFVRLVDVRVAAGPGNGEGVAIVAQDGSQAKVTIDVEDPFAAFDPASPPAAGSRFVGLRAAFENTGQTPFFAEPTELYLRAADGSLYWPTFVQRPAGFSDPDLGSQALAPGDRISGFVGYVVPETASIEGVDLWPSGDLRVEVVDLAAAPRAASTENPVATPLPPSPSPESPPDPTGSAEPKASPTPEPSPGVAM